MTDLLIATRPTHTPAQRVAQLLLIAMLTVATLTVATVLYPDTLTAQESTLAPKGYEAPTGFSKTVGRPVMVTVEQELEGRVEFSNFGISQYPLDHEETLVFVDELQTISDDRVEAQRYYIKHESDTNGEVTDSIFSGLECNYVYEGEEVKVELGGDRSALDQDLDTVIADYNAIGLWVKFPKTAKVGEHVTLDLANVAMLLGQHGMTVESANANLLFESYDRLNTEARFSGSVLMKQVGYVDGVDAELKLEGDLTLIVSISNAVVARAEFRGDFAYDGNVRGSGKIRSKLTTELDGKKIANDRRRKARFRNRVYRLPKVGIQLKLPAYWAQMRGSADEVLLGRTLDFDKGVAYLEVKFIDGDASNPSLFFDKVEGALRDDYPDLVTRKVKSRLGAGRAYYIKSGVGKDTELFRSELYPWKGKFLLLRVFGPPKIYSRADKEFLKAQSSIGPIRY